MCQSEINNKMKEKTKNIILNLWSKVPQKAKDIFVKIYFNIQNLAKSESGKKIFLPITIAFGLVFLILVAGLLFGNRNKVATFVKTSPSPISPIQTEAPGDNGSPLSQIEKKLNDLKTQIGTFDAKQSRLTPPTVNFNIKF